MKKVDKNNIPNTENIKKKNKKKVVITYCISTIILIYFVYCIIQLIKQPTDVIAIENGNLSEEESAIGYVIREETVLQGNNYKNGMVQIKAEGEKVAKGDPVFRYYSANEETLIKKIQELDIKIQEAMENETNIYSGDIKLLETQIQEKLIELETLNDIQKISEYKKDINTKITKKAKIAGERSPQGSYIRKLIDERSSYENKLNSGSEYINAESSGIVSYRVDGLESVLTPDSFSSLNTKLLQDLKLKTGEIVSSSGENGKIINNFEGYIVATVNSDKAMQAQIGDKVDLRLSNSEEISAEVVYIVEEENGRLITFKIDSGIEILASYRKITIDIIWWSYRGLKVPNSALISEKGRQGCEEEGKDIYFVIRNRAGYTDKIPIKILKQNSSYSIITNYETSELKEKWGYTDNEIKELRNIVVHDEIMVNPKK